jgi:hypothetical protein
VTTVTAASTSAAVQCGELGGHPPWGHGVVTTWLLVVALAVAVAVVVELRGS